MNWTEKAAQIKAVVMDIDGVLTNGFIGYGGGSEDEIKFFNVKDGAGIHCARLVGLKVGAVTGRICKANRTRLLKDLHIELLLENTQDKRTGLKQVCESFGITPEEVLYIGDDLIDLPAFMIAGIRVAVGDANDFLKQHADYVTTHLGGHGAVREAIEKLLLARGDWDRVLDDYMQRGTNA